MAEDQTTIPMKQYLLMIEKANLRDQFAMAALSGIMSRNNFPPTVSKAEIAYQLADAMLEARKEKK